jgi:hypothetical protein
MVHVPGPLRDQSGVEGPGLLALHAPVEHRLAAQNRSV